MLDKDALGVPVGLFLPTNKPWMPNSSLHGFIIRNHLYPELSLHVDLIPDNSRRSFAFIEKTGSIGFCKLRLGVELKIRGGQVPLGSSKS